MELLFKQVVGLVNYYSLVNCYALGATGQFRIDFLYIDLVRHNSVRISLFSKFSIFRKFVFILCPALPLSLSFSYSNVEVENSEEVFQPFSSLAGTISPQIVMSI